MKTKFLALLALFALFASANPVVADDASALTDAQRKAVKDVVRELLTKEDPGIVKEAIEQLQQNEAAATATQMKKAVQDAHDRIFNDPNSPVTGNPKGDVTIVEFYDYQCPYCKSAQAALQKLIEDDGKIRFVHKEYPIFGATSNAATYAALASVRQGKFEALYKSLFAFKGHFAGEEDVMSVASKTGLDMAQLKKDMADEAIKKMVADNMKLGQEVGARGTPLFIIGEQVFPGALDYDALKAAVVKARAANKG